MRRKPAGFSLVEIILALGIFAFAAVTILTLLNRDLQTGRELTLESSAGILSGKITSLLKASYAWTDDYRNNWNLEKILGNKNLSQIAAGNAVSTTNLFTRALVHEDDDERAAADALEIEVVTEISPLNDSGASGSVKGDSELNQAIDRISSLGKNAVFVRIKISFPAKAPDAVRSTREFAAIITKTADD